MIDDEVDALLSVFCPRTPIPMNGTATV